jgi:death-on-curing family protein
LNSAPNWLTYDQIVAVHGRQLRRFGGAAGMRDDGLLRSAIERPINKWHYEQADLPGLAAAHAFGLAKNHAFVDGNKRIAFMSMMLFLRNEWRKVCTRSGAGDQNHIVARGRRGERRESRALDSR